MTARSRIPSTLVAVAPWPNGEDYGRLTALSANMASLESLASVDVAARFTERATMTTKQKAVTGARNAERMEAIRLLRAVVANRKTPIGACAYINTAIKLLEAAQ